MIPGDPAAAIEVRGLTRRFGDRDAVLDLSFDVREGELFGLVGPDGAGKTTTLRMLAGVLRPTAGDALVLGASVARDPERMKPELAYMPQRFGLYSDLTVRENLDFYADLYGLPRGAGREERIERLYGFSNLAPFEGRLAGNLSGGMKQKLGLSCALVHRPRLLLLDEPTFGVDPISRRDLWLILHEMNARGVTVFVSTAYLDEAERCDRVAMLEQGRVVALDTPDALQRAVRGEILAVHAADPRKALGVLRAVPLVRRATLFGDAVHVTFDSRTRDWPVARAALDVAGIPVHATEEIEASLEDAFIDLVAAAARS